MLFHLCASLTPTYLSAFSSNVTLPQGSCGSYYPNMATVNVFHGTRSSHNVSLTIRSLKSVVCVPFPWIQVSLRLLQWKGPKRNVGCCCCFTISWEQQHPIRTTGGQFTPRPAPFSRAAGVDSRPGSAHTPPPASVNGHVTQAGPMRLKSSNKKGTVTRPENKHRCAWKSKSPLVLLYNNFYSFTFGGAGSSLLHGPFSSLQCAGANLCWGMWASHCGSFSCCRAQAPGTWTQ